MDSIRSSVLRPARLTTLLAAVALTAAACSTYDSTSRKIASAITPYRINIVQGNFVSREAAAQLREGMTRDQVRFLLGTPLLTDVFHANRWDYVFSFKRGNTQVVQQRRFTVFFENDRLVRFTGDELPSEYELIAEIDGIKGGPRAKADQQKAEDKESAKATEAAPRPVGQSGVPGDGTTEQAASAAPADASLNLTK